MDPARGHGKDDFLPPLPLLRPVQELPGAKSGAARLERMKHGRGIKDRDDKSSGIEIRMADDLAKINPTDPLILA